MTILSSDQADLAVSNRSRLTETMPKATLYWNPTSVWSTVPRLALYEKGYSDDDVVLKVVDISRGANFTPSYLKINHYGTIPTLVVPILETTGPEIATRYRSLKDTMSILAFLDSARSSANVKSSQSSDNSALADASGVNNPAPTLSPATVEAKNISDSLTLCVHLSSADPNFILLAARSGHELLQKESGFSGEWVRLRQEALIHLLKEAPVGAPERTFLEKKLAANSILYEIYFTRESGQETEERRKVFFQASQRAWTVGVVEVLTTLERDMVGPYALGEDISLADLHLIAWLSRIVFLSQGTATESGIDAVEKQINGTIALMGSPSDDANFKVGTKLRVFWEAWIKRESFKEIYLNGLH